MKKVVAIIQARMGSTRLPGKVLMDVAGKPMLWHIIERVKKSKKVDLIVVATTNKDEDKKLIKLAQDCSVNAFAGSEENVLERYIKAANKFDADIIVRITGDCPFIMPDTIDEMIEVCLSNNADYINFHPSYITIEEGIEVVRFSALKKVIELASNTRHREHVTSFIRENPQLFNISVIIPSKIFQRDDIRVTVDNIEDLDFVKKIYNLFYKEEEIISLNVVVRFLDENPELISINANVKKSEINQYLNSEIMRLNILKNMEKINDKNLTMDKKLKKKIVFRCDASTEIGMGHLIRSLTVANELSRRNIIIFASEINQTNSFINKNNFDIFKKKDNESEEFFLTRVTNNLRPDILYIDKKYNYKSGFLNDLKKKNVKIVMMDNLCEGLLHCDEIIFHNMYVDNNLLKKCIPNEKIGIVKSGPGFIILRDDILDIKNKIERDLHNPPNIIVTTGGSDPKGILIKISEWLKYMNLIANIYLLVGNTFRFKDKLDEIREKLPNNFHFVPYSVQEFIKADIVICNFGVTLYEMIYLQIPTICISNSVENANDSMAINEKYNVYKDIGYIDDINKSDLKIAIRDILKEGNHKQMVKRCDNLIDGLGAKRLGQIIIRCN